MSKEVLTSEQRIARYWCPDRDSSDHAYEIECGLRDLDEIFELVAEDFHGEHDGWECAWPIKFAVQVDGEIHHVLIDREAVPTFSVVSHDKQ